MAPSKNESHSNRHGENVDRQANVLASAYCVDSYTRLTGFHYSTTGAGGSFIPGQSGIPEALSGIPSPPSSPPLAALTSANEIALIRKSSSSKQRDNNGRRKGRRGGATHHIREEGDKLFCETMRAVFLGEEGSMAAGSIGMGANGHSPPEEGMDVSKSYFGHGTSRHSIDAWLEIWDYRGGCSFRGFVGGNGETKSLFAFFDSAVVGRDLKQGLMALIELAETVFAVGQVIICVDRAIPEDEKKTFMKSLRWVGFEMTTLDVWANALDVTSDKWLFLGMEI